MNRWASLRESLVISPLVLMEMQYLREIGHARRLEYRSAR